MILAARHKNEQCTRMAPRKLGFKARQFIIVTVFRWHCLGKYQLPYENYPVDYETMPFFLSLFTAALDSRGELTPAAVELGKSFVNIIVWVQFHSLPANTEAAALADCDVSEPRT